MEKIVYKLWFTVHQNGKQIWSAGPQFQNDASVVPNKLPAGISECGNMRIDHPEMLPNVPVKGDMLEYHVDREQQSNVRKELLAQIKKYGASYTDRNGKPLMHIDDIVLDDEPFTTVTKSEVEICYHLEKCKLNNL